MTLAPPRLPFGQKHTRPIFRASGGTTAEQGRYAAKKLPQQAGEPVRYGVYDKKTGKFHSDASGTPKAFDSVESAKNGLSDSQRKQASGRFPAGTLVDTPNGPKPIEKMRSGDAVVVYDLSRVEWSTDTVLEAFSLEYEGDLVHIDVAGESLCATVNHPVWVVEGFALHDRPPSEHAPETELGGFAGRWVDASDLVVGDLLLLRPDILADITAIRIAIRIAPHTETVYNFAVDTHHNYCVGECRALVHNTNKCDEAVKAAWEEANRLHPNDRAARKAKFAESLKNIQLDKLAGQLRLRERQIELGWNHEQNRFDFQEGLGGARYEQITGTRLSKPKIEGVDFVDPKVGPISMKGPLGIDSRTGKAFPITQQMVDGLQRSVIKDVHRNSATKRVVVDLRGLSESQRSTLIRNIHNAVGNFPAKEIFFVY